jgi:hypothetical protein
MKRAILLVMVALLAMLILGPMAVAQTVMETASPTASPSAVPPSGGPSILLPAAALLLGRPVNGPALLEPGESLHFPGSLLCGRRGVGGLCHADSFE